MISVSLCTQTELPNLTIQVLKYKSPLHRYNSYTYLTSIYYNLELGLAIVIESFSLLDLDYITSFFKLQIRSDVASHAILILSICQTGLNWPQLKLDADVMH